MDKDAPEDSIICILPLKNSEEKIKEHLKDLKLTS